MRRLPLININGNIASRSTLPLAFSLAHHKPVEKFSKMKSKLHNLFNRARPFIGVIFLQVGLAGMDVLSKAALNQGMSNYVLVVYRHAVATLVMTPFAAFLDKFSFSLLFKSFNYLLWKFMTKKIKQKIYKVRRFCLNLKGCYFLLLTGR